jgi:hypothetical protein
MYRKWPGKAELVADALRHQVEDRAVELPDTGSVRGDLRLTVRSIAQTLTGGEPPGDDEQRALVEETLLPLLNLRALA